MTNWGFYEGHESEFSETIAFLVEGHMKKQAELADAAVLEAIELDGHDRHIIKAYMAGKLNVTNQEVRDLLNYEYQTVYAGPNFVEVRRKIKDKDNG